ncbi:MAG: hypothetical protein ACRDRH_08845 [Pseudonocardia sp.]
MTTPNGAPQNSAPAVSDPTTAGHPVPAYTPPPADPPMVPSSWSAAPDRPWFLPPSSPQYQAAQPVTGQQPRPSPQPLPSPQPRGRGHWMALFAVVAIVLSGLGLGTFLLVRGGSTAASTPANFQTVRTPFLIYAVPPDWNTAAPPQTLPGAVFIGAADAPGYECGGQRYLRGSAASALVETTRPAADVAATFARALGGGYYTSNSGTPPEVIVSPGRAVDVAGAPGTLVEATVRTPEDDGCLATRGTLLVLALPAAGPSGAATALLVVNGDTAGGPAAAPPVPARETLDAIVNSARLATI